MEIVKNKPDRNRPIQIIDAKQFMVSTKKTKEADTIVSVKPEVMEEAVKDFNEEKNRIVSYQHKPKKSEGSLFLDLNSVLVKFWRENDVRDRDMKIRLMERMTNWIKEAGTVTLDFGNALDDGQPPKWVYRLEFKDDSCGLWYNGKGGWCFEDGIGSLSDECKTKTLPMDYDWRYKQDGRDWFSACSKKEDLMHWYSLEDAKTLIDKGFVFTRYLATEYHEYDLETVFIKETALKREEIDIFKLFGDDKRRDCNR